MNFKIALMKQEKNEEVKNSPISEKSKKDRPQSPLIIQIPPDQKGRDRLRFKGLNQFNPIFRKSIRKI